MRTKARKDRNQDLIVEALRKAGVYVRIMNNPDLPDLLCGYMGVTVLIEIKDGERFPSERRLRPGQQKFFNEWTGGPLAKIETIGEAFNLLGIPIN